jgi:hypothetical protein
MKKIEGVELIELVEQANVMLLAALITCAVVAVAIIFGVILSLCS